MLLIQTLQLTPISGAVSALTVNLKADANSIANGHRAITILTFRSDNYCRCVTINIGEYNQCCWYLRFKIVRALMLQLHQHLILVTCSG